MRGWGGRGWWRDAGAAARRARAAAAPAAVPAVLRGPVAGPVRVARPALQARACAAAARQRTGRAIRRRQRRGVAPATEGLLLAARRAFGRPCACCPCLAGLTALSPRRLVQDATDMEAQCADEAAVERCLQHHAPRPRDHPRSPLHRQGGRSLSRPTAHLFRCPCLAPLRPRSPACPIPSGNTRFHLPMSAVSLRRMLPAPPCPSLPLALEKGLINACGRWQGGLDNYLVNTRPDKLDSELGMWLKEQVCFTRPLSLAVARGLVHHRTLSLFSCEAGLSMGQRT